MEDFGRDHIFSGGTEGGSVGVANESIQKGSHMKKCPRGGGRGIIEMGDHRNITEPYGGSSKFFRDTTKIFQRTPPPVLPISLLLLCLRIPN